MTQEELLKNYNEVKEVIDNAQNDTTPFAVVDENGDISVAGDANKTELKKNDYTVTYRFPKGTKIKDGRETARGIERDVIYKNIFISPRKDMKILKYGAELYPYFKKVTEDGTIEDYEDNEVMGLIRELSDDMIDRMIDLVACVLDIDEQLRDFITPRSVLVNLIKIFSDFPEVANETDTFFE